MNDDFKKFKRKIILHAVIESVITGLAAGLIVVAAMLLPFTLTGISVNIGVYIGAGVSIFVIVGGLTFLVQRPTDKRIARRLDSELSMNEKVQTMVAFRSSEDSMAAIQRNDASARLSAAGTKKIKFKRVWQCSVASVVAVGLFAGAVSVAVLNTNVAEAGSPLHEVDITGLKNLIGTVERSSLDEEAKQLTLNELYGLLDAVYDEETATPIDITYSRKVELVTNAIINIDAAIDAVISAEILGTSMYTLSTNQILSEMGIHIRALSSGTTYTSLEALSDSLEDEQFAALESAVASQTISSYASQIVLSLSATDISAEDALYSGLMQMADGLSSAAALTSEGDDEALKAEMLESARDAVNQSTPVIRVEIQSQNTERQLGLTVINRLPDIFFEDDEIFEMPDIGELYEDRIPGSENNGDDEDDDDGPSSGGAGHGDSLYGGNSLIYDYMSGEQVEYGEVFDRYDAIIVSLINDGRIDEKYVEMITAYRRALLDAREETQE